MERGESALRTLFPAAAFDTAVKPGIVFFASVKNTSMTTESKILKGQRDRRRIDVNDPVDVEYVHHQFPWLSHQEIKEAIKKYGPDREDVRTALERAGAH